VRPNYLLITLFSLILLSCAPVDGNISAPGDTHARVSDLACFNQTPSSAAGQQSPPTESCDQLCAAAGAACTAVAVSGPTVTAP